MTMEVRWKPGTVAAYPSPQNAASSVLLSPALLLATFTDNPSVIIENTSLLKMNYASNAACKRKRLEKFKPAT